VGIAAADVFIRECEGVRGERVLQSLSAARGLCICAYQPRRRSGGKEPWAAEGTALDGERERARRRWPLDQS
jgi:hypothetical protein